MDSILHALGGLLLKAVPTFVLVLILFLYLKRMFFRPLEKLLEARYAATEGARKLAQEGLEAAARKAGEYEAAVRAARGEIYKEHEEARRRWREEQARALDEARRIAQAKVGEAKGRLAADVRQAKSALEAESETLAEQIAGSILQRRAH